VLGLVAPVLDVRLEWQYPPGRFGDGTNKPPNFLRSSSPYAAREMLQGRSRAISGYRDRKLSDRGLLDKIGGIFLFPQDRNLQARVLGEGNGDVRERHAAEPDEGVDTERHGRGVEPRPIWGTLEYLSSYVRARREREDLPDAENWEKRIQDQFNAICRPKQYLGFFYEEDDPRGAPYIQDGDTIYPLSVAASGEQVILEYVTRLNHPSPVNHSLVLIDEPEVHLHPGWIRQLYRVLPEIGTGNQYIVTTHSLELRSMAAEDGALIDMGELQV